MGFADALDREAEWLSVPGTDGLPDLTTVFEQIQARWPRTPGRKATGLYVLHDPSQSGVVDRDTNQRARWTHRILLRIVWPYTDPAGTRENDQAALDAAIDQVCTRLMGFVGDHTHGARFLSACEDTTRLTVTYADPASNEGALMAHITYTVDDFDFTN